MKVVCVHGWGFDAAVWDDLAPLLSLPVHRYDLGFTGHPVDVAPDIDADCIVIGHSLGVLWVLEHMPVAPKALVAINGFTRFTEAEGFPGVATRVLARMRKGLETAPDAVLADFLKRCGTNVGLARRDDAKLAEGLRWLAEWDRRETFDVLACPTLVLAGERDPIVPPAMTQACFDGAKTEVLWADGGHLLPLTHPAWCADRIDAFLKALA